MTRSYTLMVAVSFFNPENDVRVVSVWSSPNLYKRLMTSSSKRTFKLMGNTSSPSSAALELLITNFFPVSISEECFQDVDELVPNPKMKASQHHLGPCLRRLASGLQIDHDFSGAKGLRVDRQPHRVEDAIWVRRQVIEYPSTDLSSRDRKCNASTPRLSSLHE